MRPFSSFLVLVWFSLTVSCQMTDDERCAGKDGYVYEDGACRVPVSSDTDTGISGGGDSGSDTGTGEPGLTGFGEPCTDDTEHTDCAGFDADFCAKMPSETTGQCTFSGCSETPNDCPQSLHCCALPPDLGYPSLCLPEAEYNQYVRFCGNGV